MRRRAGSRDQGVRGDDGSAAGSRLLGGLRARMVCRSAQINLVDPRRVSGGEKGQKNARIAGRLWSEDDGCSRGF